ncbi:hypothetical protein K7X08_035930 [Anisodus acutangulus]|uniref:Uncharacterized protein n=1 Tax=Anisodus acutangulus TaxID=402998 RepID=A0A9Q1L7K2_9SOLA|nr:hypothetical protein K7X08_035930 [Anisodus acutangulus]
MEFSLQKDFNIWELEDVGAFLCKMQPVVLDSHKDYAMFSKASKDGEYSVNSFYRLIHENSVEHSVCVGNPKLNQGDPRSCDDLKTRHSEEIDEAVAGKNVDNVKRKGNERVTTNDSDDENVTKKRKTAVESQGIPCESIPETVPATPDDVDDMKVKNVFSTEDERLPLDLEGLAFEPLLESSQSHRMSDGFFCTQAPKADMGDGVDGGVCVGEGNGSQSDIVFVSVSESAIAAITQKYHTAKKGENEKRNEKSIKYGCPENTIVNVVVTEQPRENRLPQGGDVASVDAYNESIDGGLAKMSEYVLAPPPEDVVRPQTGQLADEVPAKAEDIVKDCGVGPSRVGGGIVIPKRKSLTL